jgi:molybdate transport system permease protein
MRRALGTIALFLTAAVALGFLVLPIVAIFVHTEPGNLFAQLSNPAVVDALVVSLKASAIAQALVVVFGTPTAYLIAGRRFRGRSLVITLIELPLVLPPAVAGLGLLVAFGRYGLLGSTLDVFGVSLPFTQTAVVLAVTFVASPLYLRQAIAAFESVDASLVAASRTLGVGSTRTFFRVILPLARPGLAAGFALSLARGLGEFGATIMFAGSLQGVTQTLPLAIYAEFDRNFDATLAMGALLVVLSAALLLTLKLTSLWHASRRSSRSPSGLLSWS